MPGLEGPSVVKPLTSLDESHSKIHNPPVQTAGLDKLGPRVVIGRYGAHRVVVAVSVLRPGQVIVGIVEISEAGLTDPTDESGKWAAVRVKPKTKLPNPVTLKQIKAEPQLADCELVKLSRLSVAEIKPEEWSVILEMAGI